MTRARNKILPILMAIAVLFSAVSSFCTLPTEASSPSKYKWSEKAAPNYVVKVGKAKVSNKPKKGKIKYSKLDKYGRTRRAVGNITYKMVLKSKGWREQFSSDDDPSGWGKNRIVSIPLYNGKYYRGYLYNRSHLIADSLGGRAIRRNLITGTRMQNVGANDGLGGMAYMERKVVAYLNSHHKASVYYSARPVYKGKELIPRSVIVDVRSSDKKLNERVIVYNAAKGFKINYKTGMPKKTSKSSSYSKTTSKTTKTKVVPASSGNVYITATGKKYHTTKGCRGLSNAKAIYETTKKKALASGLSPCSICAN